MSPIIMSLSVEMPPYMPANSAAEQVEELEEEVVEVEVVVVAMVLDTPS
jgi:hypothetical protein